MRNIVWVIEGNVYVDITNVQMTYNNGADAGNRPYVGFWKISGYGDKFLGACQVPTEKAGYMLMEAIARKIAHTDYSIVLPVADMAKELSADYEEDWPCK